MSKFSYKDIECPRWTRPLCSLLYFLTYSRELTQFLSDIKNLLHIVSSLVVPRTRLAYKMCCGFCGTAKVHLIKSCNPPIDLYLNFEIPSLKKSTCMVNCQGTTHLRHAIADTEKWSDL